MKAISYSGRLFVAEAHSAMLKHACGQLPVSWQFVARAEGACRMSLDPSDQDVTSICKSVFMQNTDPKDRGNEADWSCEIGLHDWERL